MKDIPTRISFLAEPLAVSLGLTIWGVEAAFGARSLVRVYVEKEGGVSIGECAELSRLLGLTLEVEAIIESAYTLEVSSPGLERIFFTFEQLSAAIGKKVECILVAPAPEYPGRRKYVGTLAFVENNLVTLSLDDASAIGASSNVFTVEYKTIKRARQVYEPPIKTRPGRSVSAKKDVAKSSIKHEVVRDLAGDLKEGMDVDDLLQ